MGQDRRTCGMDKMYRVLKGMLVICAVFAVMLLLPNSANAASKSSLKKKLQNKTSQTIYISICGSRSSWNQRGRSPYRR